MRPSESLLLALLGAGCAVPLDGPYPPDAAGAGAPPPAGVSVGGCVPFQTAGVVPVGAGISIDADGGRSLWVFDGVTGGASPLQAAGALVDESAGVNGCFAGVALGPVLDTTLLPAGSIVSPLDLVTAGGETFLYYQLARVDPTAAFGVHPVGTGVARYDVATARFAVTKSLLWTADRPTYGVSALAVGGEVFTYGCQSSAPLDEDCYVAKVAAGRLEDPEAYAYYAGSGRFASSADDARAVVLHAGSPVSVRLAPQRGELLMTYVPPLGDALVIRSGLTPEGPFSAEHALGLCELPDDPAYFCAGGAQHPELAVAPDRLVVSYAPATLSAGKAPEPPRMAVVSLPAELP